MRLTRGRHWSRESSRSKECATHPPTCDQSHAAVQLEVLQHLLAQPPGLHLIRRGLIID